MRSGDRVIGSSGEVRRLRLVSYFVNESDSSSEIWAAFMDAANGRFACFVLIGRKV
jgi:hypothetical protein